MIVFVTKDMQDQYREELHQYFLLRKKIFCDYYGWAEPNPDGTETDHLDDVENVYILYIDPETGDVIGGARMVPSTGETLMHTCWVDMLPEPDDFRSPDIWEATRLCVDPGTNSGRSRDFVNRATMSVTLAVLDFAAENDIWGVMAVCETRVVRMAQVFGAGPEVVSQKIDKDGCDISFVIWVPKSGIRESIGWARQYMGDARPPNYVEAA